MRRKVKSELPMAVNLRRLTLDADDMSQITVTGTKGSRRKRLKVRRLKYTCRAKTQGGEGEKELNEDTKEISASLSSSSEKDVVLSCERDSSEILTACGSVSVIGRRREMEDAVRVEVGFMKKINNKVYDFFGVYDGHGGPNVARACGERLHGVLVEEVEVGGRGGESDEGVEYWERVMEVCFDKMDEELKGSGVGRTVGTTAVVAVVGEEEVVVANCGDCRAVLCRGGVALALSNDHKPDRPDELSRIEAAGGKVIDWNGQRVLGVLATSRSLGDHYLRPYVISKPEVRLTRRTDKDEFLILASDGLWDVVSNEVACQVVKRCLNGRMKRNFLEVEDESRAAQAAAVLAELAISRGSRDNISVIVVDLRKRAGSLC